MDRTLKTPKSYTLDPTVAAWVARKAATLKLENIEEAGRISESSLVNDILKAAMEIESGGEDTAHLRKLVRKHILRNKVR